MMLCRRWVKDNIQDWRDVIIVSPDAGGAKRLVFASSPSSYVMTLTFYLPTTVPPHSLTVSTSTLPSSTEIVPRAMDPTQKGGWRSS